MEGPEEPAPRGNGPAGPLGGSGNHGVREVAKSTSVSWDRPRPEEAKATVRGGECTVRVHPPPTPGRSQASAPSAPALMDSVCEGCGPTSRFSRVTSVINWCDMGQGLEIPGTQPRMRSQLSYDFAFPPSRSVLGCEPPGLLRVGCPSFPPSGQTQPRVKICGMFHLPETCCTYNVCRI